jgi:hypothetical protein
VVLFSVRTFVVCEQITKHGMCDNANPVCARIVVTIVVGVVRVIVVVVVGFVMLLTSAGQDRSGSLLRYYLANLLTLGFGIPAPPPPAHLCHGPPVFVVTHNTGLMQS